MQLRRAPLLTFALSLLALQACGGSPDKAGDDLAVASADAAGPPDAREADASEAASSFEATSGSRIQGVYLQTADGTSALATLHDAQLDIDCAWKIAADGALRCLPTSVVDTEPEFGLTYADSDCTVAVYEIAATACAPPAGSYVTTGLDMCPLGTRVLAVGAQIVPPAKVYALNGPDGMCVPGNSITTQMFFSLSEVGQGLFARGEDVAVPSGALTSMIVDGSDGSRSFRALRDDVNGMECAFTRATDGMLRCLPDADAVVHAASFADSSCLVPDLVLFQHDCPLAFAPADASGCPLTTTVYAAGAPVAEEFDGAPGSCESVDLIGADIYSTAGIVPPATFVAGTPDVLAQPASARLQLRVVNAGATSVSASDVKGPSFHDTMRNEDCVPLPAADDVTRCLPFPVEDQTALAVLSTGGATFFADAGCTVPIAVAPYAPYAPCSTPAYAFAIQGTSACATATASVRVYSITGTHAGTISSKTGSMPCMPQPLPPGLVVYDVGPEVSASAFMELTRTTH